MTNQRTDRRMSRRMDSQTKKWLIELYELHKNIYYGFKLGETLFKQLCDGRTDGRTNGRTDKPKSSLKRFIHALETFINERKVIAKTADFNA